MFFFVVYIDRNGFPIGWSHVDVGRFCRALRLPREWVVVGSLRGVMSDVLCAIHQRSAVLFRGGWADSDKGLRVQWLNHAILHCSVIDLSCVCLIHDLGLRVIESFLSLESELKSAVSVPHGLFCLWKAPSDCPSVSFTSVARHCATGMILVYSYQRVALAEGYRCKGRNNTDT